MTAQTLPDTQLGQRPQALAPLDFSFWKTIPSTRPGAWRIASREVLLLSDTTHLILPTAPLRQWRGMELDMLALTGDAALLRFIRTSLMAAPRRVLSTWSTI